MDTSGQARVAAFVAEMHRTISQERLETYRPTMSGSDLEMIVNYYWNIALSEALFPTILTFEVALRNTIHTTLSAAYGAYWFDSPRLLLPREQKEVAATKQYLQDAGKQLNDGRIIAGSSFRLWVWMFNRPYESKIWHPNKQALLRAAFPHLPRPFRNRAAVEKRVDEIRLLRNRISHSEAIWNRPHLEEEHENILRAIRWISPTAEAVIRDLDRFESVYKAGKTRIERDLKRRIGIQTRVPGQEP